jgi:1-pyrroline-5-carboxylate dehydrogenase
MPDGVINFIPGSGAQIGDIAIHHPLFAGVHFTGGTNTFNSIWKKIIGNLENYRSYPKIVGETGGKGFVFVHKSADPRQVAIAILKGAFEYQGQKCSAASRAYIPASLWSAVKSILQEEVATIKMGDVKDVQNFMNAVIDEASYNNIMSYISYAKASSEAEIVTGGNGNNSVGYFVEPTIVKTNNPHFKLLEEEIFGPVMTIFVYEDEKLEETLKICDETSPYALTGAIFAEKREDLVYMCRILRYAAGNFYYNDKPSGAMVGLQPFGGARMSGTNDKAGGFMNLIRWVSPRTIKETFNPSEDYRYDYMK